MKRLLAARLGLVFLLWVGLVVSAQAQQKATRLELTTKDLEESLGTEWAGVYLLGKKVGYAKSVVTRVDDAKGGGFMASIDLNMAIVSLGAKQQITMRQEFTFDGDPSYALRGGLLVQDDGNAVKKNVLRRTDKGLEVVKSVGQETATQTLAKQDFTLADFLTPSLWAKHGPKPGDHLVTRTFDLEVLKPEIETRKLLSTKSSRVQGVPVTFHEVQMTTTRINVPMLERYDQRGRMLSGVMGGVVEIRTETEQQAKDLQASTDLFVFGSVKVDKPLGDPRRISGLVLEVQAKDGAALKSGPRQTVERGQNGTFICKTGPAFANAVAATPKEIEECLKETDNYPIKNPKIQALAKEAIGDATTPRDKVDRLVHFVARYMKPDYQTRPRNVLNLLTVKKGACTEFALLFTSLARAAGIPAREVTGLVYMGDDPKSFGPHAWNEVVLEGQWVPIDTAWDETAINPTHISLASGDSDNLNSLAGFLASLGRLSFKVVEVTRKP